MHLSGHWTCLSRPLHQPGMSRTVLALSAACILPALSCTPAPAKVPEGSTFACTATAVWDGDGPIWCEEGPRIRLRGIAAREIDGTCRPGHPLSRRRAGRTARRSAGDAAGRCHRTPAIRSCGGRARPSLVHGRGGKLRPRRGRLPLAERARPVMCDGGEQGGAEVAALLGRQAMRVKVENALWTAAALAVIGAALLIR